MATSFAVVDVIPGEQCIVCQRDITPGYDFMCPDCTLSPMCGPCFFDHRERLC